MVALFFFITTDRFSNHHIFGHDQPKFVVQFGVAH